MKVSTVLCLFALALCFLPAVSLAQITFTASGLQSTLLNSNLTNYLDRDTMTINLGVASNSQQNFDFSQLPWTSGESGDTVHTAFVSPSGQFHASEFPDATICVSINRIMPYGQSTLAVTYAIYMKIVATGWYNLGGAAQWQWTPSPPQGQRDTTTVAHYLALQTPLPATLGTQQTWTDTTYDPTNTTSVSMTIEAQTASLDGWGNVTYPDGRTLSSLRSLVDLVSTTYLGGVFSSRSHSKSVSFVAEDYTQLHFTVDTTYTGGTALTHNHTFMLKTGTVGVRERSRAVPAKFNLGQNYPNPFNPTTRISFDISQTEFVSLKVYNLLGQEVATLVNGHMMPGSYEATFDASPLPSGLYFYCLSAGNFSQVRKMCLLK
ncbi:MAG: T9SS type A sorting domain-containing protein [Bacteroidota bacterium]|jgi:hypothetical protein